MYEASLKQYRDLNAVIAYQKDKNAREREEARAKGLAEGLAEGRAEGIAEGRAEERAKAELEKQELTAKAYQEKLESARKLKQLGVAPEIISQAHCLTIEDINKL